jgi:nitrite reductase/ring-hydroxylating ferredoxin subunit/uncharacterized membrane protein
MRTAASFKSHPIHVMLIPFPLAFLVGAFASDVLGTLLGLADLWTVAGYLAVGGIVMAVIAAVPGSVDYFRSVPPESSGKKRATFHALANLSAVAVFAAGLWLRGGVEAEPGLVSHAVWAVGVGLLTAGGWMGGTLVYRNQIGVDHRYARAGKWREVRADWDRPVARRDELQVDQMKLVHVDGQRIVLARRDDGYVAFDDRCPHRGGSLAGGAMICGTVQCPWHGSQFELSEGRVRAGPAETGIRTYTVREADDGIRIVRPPASGQPSPS